MSVTPETLAAALVALTKGGITPDIQELLIRGEPSRGVPPGALAAAIENVYAAGMRHGRAEMRRRAAEEACIRLDEGDPTELVVMAIMILNVETP